ncbi:MAG: hypothetical protein KDB82_04750 [Planctomycetes bacterium]|nr:hypothetical protein [Planctomycetota bacterium]
MHKLIVASTIALLLAGSLNAAAGGVIQTKDGQSQKASDIQAETISGIIWEKAKNQPGTRVRLWDLDDVRYSGQAMDEFNGLSRKLAGGRADRLIADAQQMLNAEKPSGWSDEQWEGVQLSCKFYVAMGRYLEANYGAAVDGLQDYIKEAEGKLSGVGGLVPRVSFQSAVTGKQVTNGGALNRFYLDALEALGLSYLKQGDAAKATKFAFKPLQDLTEEMSSNSGDKEYFDWSLRALRASARYAEAQKDYAGARKSYEDLARVALTKNAGRPSRAAYEAQLKVGFMQILEGDGSGAQSRFYDAKRKWEADHTDGIKTRAWQPRANWIDPDVAYLTAGSYVGMGLVEALKAKRTDDWAEALEYFSTSLSIFNADDEIRSMALLGAANAAAQLAELNKDNKIDVKVGDKTVKKAVTAETYAKLSEKYLSELTTLLPKSKAAEDESIPDIQKIINEYKGD